MIVGPDHPDHPVQQVLRERLGRDLPSPLPEGLLLGDLDLSRVYERVTWKGSNGLPSREHVRRRGAGFSLCGRVVPEERVAENYAANIGCARCATVLAEQQGYEGHVHRLNARKVVLRILEGEEA